MTPLITPFDSRTASEAELADLYVLRLAAAPIDMPQDPVPTYDAAIGQARSPLYGDVAWQQWAARVDGTVVGLGTRELLGGVNSRIGYVDVRIHPEYRRAGVGTALLRPIVDSIAAGGREIVMGIPVKPGSPGEEWVRRLGFSATRNTVILRLTVRGEGDGEGWDAPVAPGYRLVEWSTAAPDDLIASYAAARQAIADAPQGRSSFREDIQWTPETIRESERRNTESGTQERVVVAVSEADGTVAGLTTIVRHPFRPQVGLQMDTSVLREHRGHGLGLAVKCAMLRALRTEWPELERVHTSNNLENEHMLAVNRALGFRPLRELCTYEVETARLAANLARLEQ